MEQYIKKSALVAEIEKLKKSHDNWSCMGKSFHKDYKTLLSFIDTLDVIDPYEQCIQYASIEGGIKAHAEDYSFNIESELFNQLTKEQQALWRKEIEQACISGGYNGLNLARDPRYKENLEPKEVDLDALGVLANHLIACNAHGINPNYSDRELDFLEGLANNKA